MSQKKKKKKAATPLILRCSEYALNMSYLYIKKNMSYLSFGHRVATLHVLFFSREFYQAVHTTRSWIVGRSTY